MKTIKFSMSKWRIHYAMGTIIREAGFQAITDPDCYHAIIGNLANFEAKMELSHYEEGFTCERVDRTTELRFPKAGLTIKTTHDPSLSAAGKSVHLEVAFERDADRAIMNVLFQLCLQEDWFHKLIEVDGIKLKTAEWLAAALYKVAGDDAGHCATVDDAQDRRVV